MSESSAVPAGDTVPAAVAGADTADRSSRPRRRREWTEGGSSVRRWGWEMFGWAVLAFGVGVLGSAAADALIGGEAGAVVGRILLWVAYATPVVIALRRSRPRGLLRVRPIDLLYGVVLGGALRLAQGWLQIAAGGTGAWPSYPSLNGALPPGWAFDQVVTAIVVAPVIEEFFFRGLVLVAVYSAVRRLAGRTVAAPTAAVVSTALFLLAHAVFAPMTWDAVVSVSLVGLTASALVLLTGRIWGAVLVHLVYNGSWVVLATVGTLLGA